MHRVLRILKISAVVGLIVVLAFLSSPTPKGPFVIIHFNTTLHAWLLVQVLFLSFAVAAHIFLARVSVARDSAIDSPEPCASRFIPSIEPLRC